MDTIVAGINSWTRFLSDWGRRNWFFLPNKSLALVGELMVDLQ